MGIVYMLAACAHHCMHRWLPQVRQIVTSTAAPRCSPSALRGLTDSAASAHSVVVRLCPSNLSTRLPISAWYCTITGPGWYANLRSDRAGWQQVGMDFHSFWASARTKHPTRAWALQWHAAH